jgi:hypothetical protein
MVKVESAPPKNSKSEGAASILAVERCEGAPSLVGCIQAQSAETWVRSMKIQGLQPVWESFGIGISDNGGRILKQNFAHIETIALNMGRFFTCKLKVGKK